MASLAVGIQDRPRDVLDLPLAAVLERNRAGRPMPRGTRPRCRRRRIAQGARRHVDAIAEDVVAVADDIALMHANAELDPAIRRDFRVCAGIAR